MSQHSKPPAAYREFVERFPRIGQAWELVTQEGEQGPLDEKARRLVKLGVAIGALREGAVHSAVRKAVATGATAVEVEQVVALAASTVGLPSTVAAWTWVREELGRKPRRR
jgi:alkylhydroperoxidase/carboxymuconolactone decarboxylase family protein YurZ